MFEASKFALLFMGGLFGIFFYTFSLTFLLKYTEDIFSYLFDWDISQTHWYITVRVGVVLVYIYIFTFLLALVIGV